MFHEISKIFIAHLIFSWCLRDFFKLTLQLIIVFLSILYSLFKYNEEMITHDNYKMITVFILYGNVLILFRLKRNLII